MTTATKYVYVDTPQDIMESIRNLVDYSEPTESRDYDEQDSEGRDNHIYRDIRKIDAWLTRNHML